MAHSCRLAVPARQTRSGDKPTQRRMRYDGVGRADAHRCEALRAVDFLRSRYAGNRSTEVDAACGSEVDDAEPGGMRHRVGTTDRVELVDDRGDVKLCRVDGDREPPRDRLVRRAFGEQRQHLQFARG